MSRSPLWRARAEALTYLRRDRTEHVEIVDELIQLLDRCIDLYDENADSNTYARISGLTLLKAKNLALGAYSLILDGLGQEAGALLRPLIEYTELLTYFKQFPEKVESAANGDKLPSAGERAKAIGGTYKEFREHLNQNASHSSYSHYSLSHLLEPSTFRFKKLQRMAPTVLERNVLDFAVQVFFLLRQGVLGLEPFAMTQMRHLGADCDDVHDRLKALTQQ